MGLHEGIAFMRNRAPLALLEKRWPRIDFYYRVVVWCAILCCHWHMNTEIRVAILHDVPLVSAGMASALRASERFVAVSCERPTMRDQARRFWGKVDVAVTDFETGVDLMRVSAGG